MRTSEERIQELHRRMEQTRRARDYRRVRMLAAAAGTLSVAVIVLVAVWISRIPVRIPAAGPAGTAASIFAGQGALGYVITALLAFALGIMLTIFCYRLRKRLDEEDRDDRKR